MRSSVQICILLLSLTAVVGSAGLAQNGSVLSHNWDRIAYPAISPTSSQSLVPWISISNGKTQGFRFDLVYSVLATNRTQLPADSDIVVRLHRPDGRTVNSPLDKYRGQAGATTNGTSISHDYIYFFPWQDNVLEEAWIECRLPGQTYWVEVPYGFTRNPADALAPVRSLAGRPALAPAMMPMRAGDEILPWDYVEYDLGEIQNQWRAEVHVSNPFDAAAEVILYRHDTAIGKSTYLWELHTPQTRIEIDDPLTRRLPSRAMEIRLHEDGLRRSDTFSFYRNPGSDNRGWGAAFMTVEDRSYSFTLPSSLFRYTHGSPDYPKPPIPRSISR